MDEGGKDLGNVIVVSGPSGVGKSTIVRELIERTGAVFSVSATTRHPRAGEVNGRHYVFVDRTEFEAMIAEEKLLEWADVFGELYGTPAEPLQRARDQGRNVVLEIDVQGGLQVHRRVPDAIFIFITPPDHGELARRLHGRNSDSQQVISRRLTKADEEINAAKSSGVYQHWVVNNDLQRAIRQVVDVVNQECCQR